AELRRQLGIKAHDRVMVGMAHGAIVIKPAGSLLELEGFLGKALPLEAEARALGQAAAAHATGPEP
ncbi:MAG: hypothetical protein ABIL09_29260, partial [Gemmatimonadota bacterium]